MTEDTDLSWPPSPDQLAWRPTSYVFDDQLSVAALRRDGQLPDWLDGPQLGADEEDLDGAEIASCTLVAVELDSTLGDVVLVSAIEHPYGGYQILVTDENETAFVPPISVSAEPLTLGELLKVLDATAREGDQAHTGVGHFFREMNAEYQDRSELVDFVTMQSTVYPQITGLDRSRAEQWASEAGS